MYVGVILEKEFETTIDFCIPHVCGGDPNLFVHFVSPPIVFPMYVGVILLLGLLVAILFGIPHVCGGDPLADQRKSFIVGYSPCMWG